MRYDIIALKTPEMIGITTAEDVLPLRKSLDVSNVCFRSFRNFEVGWVKEWGLLS